jgi:hypothetical protein
MVKLLFSLKWRADSLGTYCHSAASRCTLCLVNALMDLSLFNAFETVEKDMFNLFAMSFMVTPFFMERSFYTSPVMKIRTKS